MTKTLTEIGGYPQLVAQIRAAIGLEEAAGATIEPGRAAAAPRAYTLADAGSELFNSESEIEELLELLRHRKNLVLQGPPGVGKTFVAKRLAWLLLGARDPERIRTVQFHQSYSYEDFIQGYRPTESGGFIVRDGPFLQFCDRALQDREVPYVMIIDEINRGNLSKIFGELLMLIEADKRDPDWGLSLAYAAESDELFYVPPNLYLIGTMNSADRSLALVDYALRRRFAFYDLEPCFDEPAFAAHLERCGVAPTLAKRLLGRLRDLNESIRADAALGPGYRVGHSYFCQKPETGFCDEDWYERIVKFEIGPLLKEYWFDRAGEADRAIEALLGD